MWIWSILLNIASAEEICTKGKSKAREACLRNQIELLQQEITELTNQLEHNDPANESQANALFAKAEPFLIQNDLYSAKPFLLEIEEKYYKTQIYQTHQKGLFREIKVLDAPMPRLENVEWIQGEEPPVLGQEGTAVMVFWELWCPHCRRELPNLNAKLETHKDHGLQVVGFTKASRDTSIKDIQTFLSENGVQFSIGKDSGNLSEQFDVTGIPAAVVVQNGTVIWRGHPARIDDDTITRWLTQ